MIIVSKAPHLTDGQLAQLVDGACTAKERLRMLDHIRKCRRCRELYQDSAVHFGEWKADTVAFSPPEGVLETGRQVAASDDEPASHKAIPKGGPRFRLPPKLGVAGAVAAAVVVVAATAIWLNRGKDGAGPLAVDPSLVAPIKLAAETATSRGGMVIPGGEAGLDRSEEVPFRSEYVPVTPALKASLDQLYQMYRHSPSPEVAQWLIAGHLASGHIALARDLAFDASTQFPRDARIATLGGIVALADGRHDHAIRALRELVESEGDPTAAVNLAVALIEAGRDVEAQSILEGLANDTANPRFAKRAASLLAAIE